MKPETYEEWSAGMIRGQDKCLVESSMHCIPLKDDPICKACYQAHVEVKYARPDTFVYEKSGKDGPHRKIK